MIAGDRPVGEGLRLAELIGALTLATDLAHQLPPENALRTALLSVEFGRHLGLSEEELSDVYYLAMVYQLGCTAVAEEQGEISDGDDAVVRHAFAGADYADRAELLRLGLREFGRSSGPLGRTRALAGFMTMTRGRMISAHVAICEASALLAERLGAGPPVCTALTEIFTRWDGKLYPLLAGERVSRIARLTHLVHVAQLHSLGNGTAGAVEVVRQRRGSELDPRLCDAFVAVAGDLFAGLGDDSVWDQTLEAEPRPHRLVPHSHVEGLTLAIADFTDLKSTRTLGHSRRVGELAARSGACLGLDAGDVMMLRRSGHVHDLGNVSVPQRVWTKHGRLNRPEREAVRLHAYHTERILSVSESLEPLGKLAGLHHERIDGSGYHRSVAAASQPAAARVLSAVEVYESMLEERSWRPAHSKRDAARQLRSQAAAGSLDRAAVQAVLEAAGEPTRSQRIAWPAELTDREVQILRHMAEGRRNREIAGALSVSEATVHTHTVNIFAKTGVHTRAGIALFAIENGLLEIARDQPNG